MNAVSTSVGQGRWKRGSWDAPEKQDTEPRQWPRLAALLLDVPLGSLVLLSWVVGLFKYELVLIF